VLGGMWRWLVEIVPVEKMIKLLGSFILLSVCAFSWEITRACKLKQMENANDLCWCVLVLAEQREQGRRWSG